MSCSQHGCKQKIFKTKKEGEKKSQFLCNLPHAHFISPYTSRGRLQRKFPISGQSDWSNQYFSSLAEDGLLGYLSCAPQEVPLLVFKKNTLEKKPQIKSQISSLLRMSWPRVEEEKRKKSSEAKAEDQRRLEKNWSKSDGYFGSGKLQIGTIMLTPPPWNIFGWQNPLIDSLWWWMLPLRVDPGSFPPLLFKPVFLSTSLFCPVAIYLYNCLCGLSPSSATDTLWFFMLMFSLLSFFGRFFPPSLWDTVLFRLSSPSPLRKHPLPRIFSEYFLLMHTYTHIYVTDSVFPPLTSYRFSWRFFSPDSTDRIRALFRPPAVTGAAVVGRGVAPSLGYLLLFLTVCPHKQNGGLLFLLLWYGGRVWGTATLGVKGGRRERATTGRRGCLRKCSGVSGNRFWALFFSHFFPFFLRIFADFNLQRTVALHFYLSQIQRLSLQRKWRATYLTIILKSTVFKQGCVQNFLVAI